MSQIYKLSIIGAGYVGTAIGTGFIGLGYDVVFYDVVAKRLPNFTMDLHSAIENSDVSFVCVPTPTTTDGIDLSYIEEATKSIGKALANKDSYHLVVVKSTVAPTTVETVVIPLLEEYSGKRVGEFGVCMNPEFLTEISDSWSKDEMMKHGFFTEDRIVIGEYDKKSGDVLDGIYKPLDKPVFRTDLITAETIKYASNCMLATKISYWNEIFMICKELGIDSQIVSNIVGRDPRIGKYGTVHGSNSCGRSRYKVPSGYKIYAEGDASDHR
jgi:UDPglucose 6-dehydrogenase